MVETLAREAGEECADLLINSIFLINAVRPLTEHFSALRSHQTAIAFLNTILKLPDELSAILHCKLAVAVHFVLKKVSNVCALIIR